MLYMALQQVKKTVPEKIQSNDKKLVARNFVVNYFIKWLAVWHGTIFGEKPATSIADREN